MIATKSLIYRSVTAVALVAAVSAGAAPAFSQTTSEKAAVSTAKDPAARQARVADRVESHLTELAKRLNINGSQQQAAWNSYANVVRAQVQDIPSPPPADADAVAVTRFRAELASKHAQKLSQLADATAQLSASLTAEQRETLNKAVRREHRGDAHRRSRGQRSTP